MASDDDDKFRSPSLTEDDRKTLLGLIGKPGQGEGVRAPGPEPESRPLAELVRCVRETSTAGGWALVESIRGRLPARVRALTIEQRLLALSTVEFGWQRAVLIAGFVELAMRERTIENEALAAFSTGKWQEQDPIEPIEFEQFREQIAPYAKGAESDPRLLRPLDDGSMTRLEFGRLSLMRVAIDTLVEALDIASTANRRLALEVLLPMLGASEGLDALSDQATERREGVRLYMQQLALVEARALELTVAEDRVLFEHRFSKLYNAGELTQAWACLQAFRSATTFSQLVEREPLALDDASLREAIRRWGDRFRSASRASADIDVYAERLATEEMLWRAGGGSGLVRALAGVQASASSGDAASSRAYPREVAVVEYLVLTTKTLAFVHRSPEPLRVHEISLGRDDIEAALAGLLWSSSSFRPARFEAPWRLDPSDPSPAVELRRLSPLVEWLPAALGDCETLIFVPSGPLHFVPFHALTTSDAPRYVIEDWVVAYDLTPRRSLAEGKLERGAGVIAGWTDKPRQRLELDAHLRRVAEFLGRDAAILLGADACPGSLLDAVGRLGEQHVLYVHGHGFHDPDDPLGSGIALAGKAGLLDGHGLAKLAHRGALAFLAACLTGRARVNPDEELVGLVRPLILSGFETVITATWSYEAHSGRALAEAFFAVWLERGLPRAAALAEAQRAMLRGDHDGQWRNPYCWAPFRLIGNWR